MISLSLGDLALTELWDQTKVKAQQSKLVQNPLKLVSDNVDII